MNNLPRSPWHHDGIERRFVDTDTGQVHLRASRHAPAGDEPPLLMIHASPASSITVTGLLAGLGQGRHCYAPDTAGFGDSEPLPLEQPEIADFAESSRKVLDALGIEQADVYGSHTGAHIAVELAIHHPSRVRRVVLDGLALFDSQEQRDVLAHYAPACQPDDIGSQFRWAWQFVRDQAIYFPYFRRDAEHLRGVDMASAETLHTLTVDVLKALTTYHLGYRAAFRHPGRERLVELRHHTLVTADTSDPLAAYRELAGELVPDSVVAEGPSTQSPDYLQKKVALIDGFLRGPA